MAEMDSRPQFEADYSVVLTTAASGEEAKSLAKGLVEAHLVACAQLLPITSVFRWNGQLEEDSEVLVLLKSKATLFEQIQEYIMAHHSYDTPEIIQLPISKGSASYLNWITEESLKAS